VEKPKIIGFFLFGFCEKKCGKVFDFFDEILIEKNVVKIREFL
jgi:hypothetical protein